MAKRGRPKKVKEESVETTAEEVNDFVRDGITESNNDTIPEDKFEQPPAYERETKSALHKLRDEGVKYSPLGESVTEKDYRTPKVENTSQIGEIDEPYFERPTLEDLVQSNSEDTEGSENPFAQPEINEMSSAARS